MRDYWKTLTILKKIKFLISIILFIFMILFIFQNWKDEKINMLFFDMYVPLSLVRGISFFIGYSMSSLFNYKEINSKDKELKSLKDSIKEGELKN